MIELVVLLHFTVLYAQSLTLYVLVIVLIHLTFIYYPCFKEWPCTEVHFFQFVRMAWGTPNKSGETWPAVDNRVRYAVLLHYSYHKKRIVQTCRLIRQNVILRSKLV